MRFTETIRVAFSALRANRMRSLLTMLGIVIGVGAVIAVIALGNGAKNSVRDRLARLGTTILQINSQRVQQGGVASASFVKLTMADVNMIRERSATVVGVNPQQDRELQVVWTNKNTRVQVTGTEPNFLQVRGFTDAADDGVEHGGRLFIDRPRVQLRECHWPDLRRAPRATCRAARSDRRVALRLTSTGRRPDFSSSRENEWLKRQPGHGRGCSRD